ncbi:MAG: ATP-binding protein [Anaerolineae bacterium]|nr:MAG: ATP-binding protein [Anaerolineae bacterium]
MLIVIAGLPGTGKSTLARRLSGRLAADGTPAIILDKDVVRAALFPSPEIEYSTRQDDFCMDVMLQAAEYVLRKDPGRHVILDGRTFSRRYQVDAVRAFARRLGVSCALVECVCSDEVVRQRLGRDVAEGRHLATNRDYQMYLSVKARAEPIREPKLTIDTEDDPDRCLQRCLEYTETEGIRLGRET